MGPFKLEVRELILSKLQALEQETGQRLITESELDVIEDIWRRDQCSSRLSCGLARCDYPKP